MLIDCVFVDSENGEKGHKLEVLRTQMHHLPFKMHWEKMRANIHMPRSVQYPSLCFFFFSTRTLSSCYFFLLFLQQVSCNERKGSSQISLPLFSSILHVGMKIKRRRYELLFCCWLSPGTVGNSIWSTIVSSFLRTDRTAPQRASVQPSPCVGALLCVEHEGTRLGALRSRWDVLLLLPPPPLLLLLSQRLETHRTNCLCSHPTPRLNN